MEEDFDPLRHNEGRVTRAHDQATSLFGPAPIVYEIPDADPLDLPFVHEPFFIGGGVHFDIYAFNVTYAAHAQRHSLEIPQEIVKNYCLRAPREHLSYEKKKMLVDDEVEWYKRLQKVKVWYGRELRSIKGIPKLMDFYCNDDNFMESPFIALEWADGKQLVWNDCKPERLADRKKVLQQVADITMAMLRVNEIDKNYAAYNWMEERIEAAIEEANSGNTASTSSSRESTPTGLSPDSAHSVRNATSRMQIIDVTMTRAESMAEKQQELLQKYYIDHLDDAPFILCHGEIDTTNLIVDDNYNVTLVNFSAANLTPLQFSAAYPRFLAHAPEPLPLSLALDNRTEKAGWAKGWGVKDTAQMRKDRAMYLEFIQQAFKREMDKYKRQKKERDDRFCTTKGAKMLEWPHRRVLGQYAELLGREDEVNKGWWLRAMNRVDVWAQMDECKWEPKKVEAVIVSSVVQG